MVAQACQVSEEFCGLSPNAQYHWICQLCHANYVVMHRRTTEAMQNVQITENHAHQWLVNICPNLTMPRTNLHFVLNMDQTLVFFCMQPNQTLEIERTKEVPILVRKGKHCHRVTVSLCVSAAGDKLKPMMIFQGAQDGRTVNKEFLMHKHWDSLCFACQKHAWQDNNNLQVWIRKILQPYLQQ